MFRIIKKIYLHNFSEVHFLFIPYNCFTLKVILRLARKHVGQDKNLNFLINLLDHGSQNQIQVVLNLLFRINTLQAKISEGHSLLRNV